MVAPITRIVLAIATSVLLAACAGGGFVPDGPPAFKAGYNDGCDQGYYDSGSGISTTPDREALATDPVYRDGYEQGHDRCYEMGHFLRRHPRPHR